MPETTATGPARAPSGASNLLKLIIAWTWVGIPGIWGIAQVAIKSLALFK